MVSFSVRTVTAASVLPAALAIAAFSSSSPSRFRFCRFPAKSDFHFPSSLVLVTTPKSLHATADPVRTNVTLHMESVAADFKHSDKQRGVLPELMVTYEK
ncbi:hypothetical protein HPP92_020712 [Vanilla planifolia]|uniref:Uncharacterized protein n=1 Tax=Vanilla planifolia TaxID=51239 RepID=A0A835UK15_VANPL|nr:hypothetical protein HPP92_020712 [Vanilla planifolia]